MARPGEASFASCCSIFSHLLLRLSYRLTSHVFGGLGAGVGENGGWRFPSCCSLNTDAVALTTET